MPFTCAKTREKKLNAVKRIIDLKNARMKVNQFGKISINYLVNKTTKLALCVSQMMMVQI